VSGIQLNRDSLGIVNNSSVPFGQFLDKTQWPYAHLYTPMLSVFLCFAKFLLDYYGPDKVDVERGGDGKKISIYRLNKKHVEKTTDVENNEVCVKTRYEENVRGVWPPKNNYLALYIWVVLYGIGMEVCWEICEWLFSEIGKVILKNPDSFLNFGINYFHEFVSDIIADIIQAVIGAIVASFICLRYLIIVPSPAILWKFRTFWNKVFVSILISCIGGITFLGIIKKEIWGITLYPGFWMWFGLELLIFASLRILDLRVIRQNKVTLDKYGYINERDLNIFWFAYLYPFAIIMHGAVLDLRVYTYFTTWTGMFLSVVYFGLVKFILNNKTTFYKKLREEGDDKWTEAKGKDLSTLEFVKEGEVIINYL
jgi:hypothetical protein